MKTERFIQLRKGEIEPHFSKDKLKKMWRQKVKHQLRGAEIRDIFDNYDFNFSIENRAETIRADILDGSYKALKPLVVKVEKKMGICRHLIIPHPSDALIMQTLSEVIFESIDDWQPSKNAFYSRDRSSRKLPHESLDDYSKDWFSQWKKMQKVILGFKESKEFVISTDVTNYFDSIDLSKLREEVSRHVMNQDKSGVLVDLLFRIIEDISWRPDYLPYTKLGLPTINLESVRLLGHSFLFEADNILKLKTKENFTRWMDDITIGVNSRKEAADVLGGIADTLKSRGLALNLAKTQLYSAKEFEFNFLVLSNRYLDSIQQKDALVSTEIRQFRNAFTAQLKNTKPQHWTKVTKRYISLHAKFKIKISEKRIVELYLQHPQLRGNLCKYLGALGNSVWSSNIVLEILTRLDTKDDIALFYIADLVTRWNLPVNDHTSEFIKRILKNISLLEAFHFFCSLWIRAKYDHPTELLNFISQFENKWKKEPFLRRQITAVMARVYKSDTKKVESLLKDQSKSNDISTVSIANHILDFSENDKLDFGVNGYIFPKKLNFYSLERFLVLCSVLNSDSVRQMPGMDTKIKRVVKDNYFEKWLSVSYNIN